ncbi:MAG: hypothetical protein ABSF63_13280 [Candidatus Bathyarchaeia archaeon]|jgi:ABC-type multidrug transport system permease subunit
MVRRLDEEKTDRMLGILMVLWIVPLGPIVALLATSSVVGQSVIWFSGIAILFVTWIVSGAAGREANRIRHEDKEL